MMRVIFYFLFLVFSVTVFGQNHVNERIQPYSKNPSFWQYKNEPLLLVGGSSIDNLFQSNARHELDLIASAGGNYVQNTMNSLGEGDERPFWRSGERFNLEKFNKEYWSSLDMFLKHASERKIIVQLEIWPFKDFTLFWDINPWNPINNNVLTEENTMLGAYSLTGNEENRNNFFLSVPKLNNDSLLLHYQHKYVDELLSVSFKYDNVIYSVTDKISPQYSIEWGWYWAGYIHSKAKEEGVQVEITEVLGYEDVLGNQYNVVFNHPELFTFIDISQNSLALNEQHWENLMGTKRLVFKELRPVNNVNIYGGQSGGWTGGPSHSIERFWRNLVGGAAACSFDAEPNGLGLSERAQKHIKSACLLAKEYDFFTSKPDENSALILEREYDESYLARNDNQDVIVYFTDGGQIVLDFTDFEGSYSLKWLNLEGANWFGENTIEGGGIIELTSPYAGGWVALLTRISTK